MKKIDKQVANLPKLQDWVIKQRNLATKTRLVVIFAVFGAFSACFVLFGFENCQRLLLLLTAILTGYLYVSGRDSNWFENRKAMLMGKLSEKLDAFTGEPAIDEIPAPPSPLILVRALSIQIQSRSTEKTKFISHIGASLRSMCLAPAFPRHIFLAA